MSDNPRGPRDPLIFLLFGLAVVALGLGVLLPVVEVSNLAIFATRFSIAEAAWQLLVDGEILLGVVIVVFSVGFPLGKIVVALAVFWRLESTGSASGRWIERLEFFGRWSCADVLIVAIAIVVTKSTGVADAQMEIGLWFFTASVVLTAVGVHRLKSLTKKPE